MVLIGSARQADYAFKLGKYSAEQLRVLRFSGSEGISELFRFQIDLASEDKSIKFDDVVGKPACMTIYGDGGPRWVHGIVNMFEQAGEGIRFKYYRAEIVPAIWRLENRYGSRIFQKDRDKDPEFDMSVPSIIRKVLKEAGFAKDQFRFVLKKKCKPRDYCVQYRETELNFISRLMEEEGIFYFFEHTKEKHVLVMGDSPTAHVMIEKPETVIYHEITGEVETEEYIYDYRYRQSVRPGSAMLMDFNFKKTKMNLQKESKDKQDVELEVYDYPGKYEESGAGQELAKVRLEELQATRQWGTGQSICRRLTSGYRFKLEGHPRKDFNREYLITRVVHRGAQPQSLEEEPGGFASEGPLYENRFECIPYDVPYRPARVTPKPVVRGIQTAIVVGPQGEEVYTDEHGRVKVQFHWDREGEYNEKKSSCWIRVSQGWAGGNYGMMFLPRVGHEVIVDFLEGDPDRPLIVGRVYNGDERPPYKLPDEKTKSTIKSSSSKGHEGSNEIRFEDAKGKEQLFIHAEKDLEIRAKGVRKESIEKDRHLIVGGEKRELIEKKKHVHVKDAQTVQIDKDSNETVKGDVVEEYQKNHAESVTQERDLNAKTIILEGKQELMIKAAGGFVKIDASGITIQGNLVKINSGGAPSVASAAGSCVAPQGPIAAVKAVYGKDTSYQQVAPPLPGPPPPGKIEKKTHWIEYQFVDGAKKPVSGLPYKFTDTTKKVEKGKLPGSGSLRKSGIPAGACNVVLGTIEDAVWGKAEASPNKEVEMIAYVSGFDPGTKATLEVYKLYKETPAEVVQKLSAAVQGNMIKSKWKYKYKKEDEGTKPQFVFHVRTDEQWVVSSNVLEISDTIEIDVKDKDGSSIANTNYTLILPSGETRRGATDAKGHIHEKDLPVGECYFRLDKYLHYKLKS